MGETPESLEARCAGEERCPITTTATTLVGKKWHPVGIHRSLESGPLDFNALKEDVDGGSSKVQSDVLKDLAENGSVDRTLVRCYGGLFDTWTVL